MTIRRLLGPLTALSFIAPSLAADRTPLTMDTGQVRQVKAGDTLVLPGTGGQIAGITIKASSNTVLQALPSTLGTVIRDGYATKGDAPALTYVASNAACTLNSGAGDTGWQVPTSDGKCWIANFGSEADIRQWGLQPGGQADTAMNRAIAFACATHTPISIPYPGNNPYLLNSSVQIGNGSATQLSTCNGVTVRGAQSYNQTTSGTTPPGPFLFRWNGTDPNIVPIYVKGPATSIVLDGISVDCENGANSCKTGIKISTIMEGRFSNLGVERNRNGPAFVITSEPTNIWNGGNEGSRYDNLSAGLPGPGGSGMQVGDTACTAGTCTWATIANTFNNVTVNYDSTVSTAYGVKLGLASQNTFINLRVACLYLFCGTAVPQPHGMIISPPPGATDFPTDNTFIHPLFLGYVDDPGSAWTGTHGQTFLGWSTVYTPFPTSTNFDLFKGSDDSGRLFPAARSWTPADASGAGLSFTVQDATYTVNGNLCTVSLALTFPSTSNANSVSINGLPSRCRPFIGSGTSRAGGAISYTTYSTSPITALMDNGGAISLYSFGGTGVTNAGMTGKALRVSFSFPIN